MKKLFLLLAGAFFLLNGCAPKQEVLTPQEAREIAKNAYVYGFPMVVNYKTLYAYTLNKRSKEFKGDFNQMGCDARVYTPADKAVVTPNSDTPYCMFWCDIRQEPVVLSIPDIEADRYYSFQLIDLLTHNFAYIGTLTTGNAAGNYLIAPSNWKGSKPEGVTDIIYCETDLFFTVVRTQLMDADDLPNVKAIQDKYRVQLLSAYLGNEAVARSGVDNFPDWQEGEQFTEAAFKYMDVLLNLTQPIESEKPLRDAFAKLNIGTPVPFDINDFELPIQEAIREGVKDGFAEMEAFIKQNAADPLGSAKIFGTRKFLSKSASSNYQLEDFYLPRAIAAHLGLYGNSGFEAIYPTYLVDSERQPLNASKNNYILTFKAGELPPVKSFWSLTMYDGQTQLLIENPINRYLLNSSMTDDFVYNPDGSLTLYIQNDSPGEKLESNWLPAPDGPFYCVLRLYGPEEVALSGEWVNPPMLLNN